MRPGGRPGLRTTPRKANEFGFGAQTAGRGKRKMRPGGHPGLCTTPRKANEFGFGTQTAGREKRERRPGGRPGLRTTPRKANEFGFCTQTAGREKRKMRPGGSNLLLLLPGAWRIKTIMTAAPISSSFYHRMNIEMGRRSGYNDAACELGESPQWKRRKEWRKVWKKF